MTARGIAPHGLASHEVMAVTQDNATRRLDWLLDPVPSAEFLQDYYEQKPLLVQGRGADRYRDVLSFEAVSYTHLTLPTSDLV